MMSPAAPMTISLEEHVARAIPDWAELWMAINGADAKSAEEQADQFMASTLNGLAIHVGLNSEIVRKALIDQFKFAEARAAIAAVREGEVDIALMLEALERSREYVDVGTKGKWRDNLLYMIDAAFDAYFNGASAPSRAKNAQVQPDPAEAMRADTHCGQCGGPLSSEYGDEEVAAKVEAMRAKCAEWARGTKYPHPTDRLEEGWNAACDEIADGLAALKDNGERK